MARQNKAQHELGAVLGLPQQSISFRVRGLRSFRSEELVALALWLRVPVTQFLPADDAGKGPGSGGAGTGPGGGAGTGPHREPVPPPPPIPPTTPRPPSKTTSAAA